MEFQSYFRMVSLDDCNLNGAILTRASFQGGTLYYANFEGANLSDSEFYIVLGMGATFDGAILRNTVIRGGSFEEASFANADLTGASFLDDNMGGAVNLCGTDFGTANLTDVLFKNAIYDENTKFPTGFAINQPGLRLKTFS
jgi:uncharacterized protein YjbI with pentapeptide repeats